MQISSVLALSLTMAIAFVAQAQSDELESCESASNCHVFQCGFSEGQTYLCTSPVGSFGDFGCDPQGSGKIVGSDEHLCDRYFPAVCHDGSVKTEITGDNRNNVTIRVGKHSWSTGVLETGHPGGFLNSGFERIRCKNDLTMERGQKYVSIRSGRNLDLFWFVGISDSGLVPLFVRLQDGRHLGVGHFSKGPLVILGRDKDVFIQYCFDGKRWTSSGVHRDGDPGSTLECGEDAITFYNVSRTEYTPPRPQAPSPPATPNLGDICLLAMGYRCKLEEKAPLESSCSCGVFESFEGWIIE